jgi:hypothetical protein
MKIGLRTMREMVSLFGKFIRVNSGCDMKDTGQINMKCSGAGHVYGKILYPETFIALYFCPSFKGTRQCNIIRILKIAAHR